MPRRWRARHTHGRRERSLVKRDRIHPLLKVVFYLVAVLLALAIGGVLLVAIGVNPLVLYKDMFTIGMIGSRFAYKSIEGLLTVFIPLLITSLALSLSFKMRFWNIGGEGQFIIGALAAATVALQFGETSSAFTAPRPALCLREGFVCVLLRCACVLRIRSAHPLTPFAMDAFRPRYVFLNEYSPSVEMIHFSS